MLSFRRRYALGERIGVGATAEVYRCTHRDSRRTYAVKVINKALLSTSQLGDLEAEVASMHALNHHSIVHLKECKEEGDHLYLVLEEMQGGDLFDRLLDSRDGHMSERDVCDLMYNLTCAVAYLHSKGFAHRDLKPENILLKGQGQDGSDSLTTSIKLADFGIATRLPDGLLNEGFCSSSNAVERAMPFYRICGSPEYMAPEVIRANVGKNRGYGIKCDVWSLGVIMYILLSGEPPFAVEEDDAGDEDNLNDTIGNIKVPPRLRKLFRIICAGQITPMQGQPWHRVSSSAKALIRRMLDPNPICRPSARQVMCDAWFRQVLERGKKKNKVRTTRTKRAKAGAPKMEVFADGDEIKDSSTALESEFLRQKKGAPVTQSIVSKARSSIAGSISNPSNEKNRLLFLARREFLLNIGRQLSLAQSLEGILADDVHNAAHLTHADRGSIFLVDSERKVMWTTVAEGMGSSRIVIPWNKGFAGSCRNGRVSVNVRDVNQDPRGKLSKNVDRKSGYSTRSILCVPVVHEDGTVMAVIQMMNKLGPDGETAPREKGARNFAFDEEDLHLLEDFAVHLSLSLSRLNTLGKHSDRQGHTTFSLPNSESGFDGGGDVDPSNGEEDESDDDDKDGHQNSRKRKSSGAGSSTLAKRKKRKKLNDANGGEEIEEDAAAGSGCTLQ